MIAHSNECKELTINKRISEPTNIDLDKKEANERFIEKSSTDNSHLHDGESVFFDNQHSHENSFNLNGLLHECSIVAEKTYSVAIAQTKQLEEILQSALNNIKEVAEYNRDDRNTSYFVNEQSRCINESLLNISSVVRNDLETLHTNMAKFSITVFGRTMAGKSTLMEILTHGDGKSIGHGGQRTTRDVRKYEWNGLSITDVPGVGAYEGKEDADIAFRAAKTADLILYLITDDAPQPETEALWLKKINDLGKPVICVCNVKSAVANENGEKHKSTKLILRDVDKAFDANQLGDLREQFLTFARCYGQTWDKSTFIYAHLLLAYEAQKPENSKVADIYYEKSRFGALEKEIIRLVKTNGKFYRTKNFVSTLSTPMFHAFESLLRQREFIYSLAHDYRESAKELNNWGHNFYISAIDRINSFINQIRAELNNAANIFSAEHFEDSHADESWQNVLCEFNIENRSINLMETLKKRIDDKLNALANSIQSKLKFRLSSYCDTSLRMDEIYDFRKWWGRISIVANAFSLLVGGWPRFVIGPISFLGNFFFDDRETKEREAQGNLRGKLIDNIATICRDLNAMMREQLEQMMRHVKMGASNIDGVVFSISRIANENTNLAEKLLDQFARMNMHLLKSIMTPAGLGDIFYGIKKVARIPGVQTLIEIPYGTVVCESIKSLFYEKMQEELYPIYPKDDPRDLIASVINNGITFDKINQNEFGGFDVSTTNISNNVQNRVRLAQVLLNAPIKILN